MEWAEDKLIKIQFDISELKRIRLRLQRTPQANEILCLPQKKQSEEKIRARITEERNRESIRAEEKA